MKLQCSCGAKYAFDITPEMAQNPVRFVCPECGADSSDFVNEMVRRELGQADPAAAPIAAAPAPAPTTGSRLRISHEEKHAAPEAETAPVSKYCARHRGVLATEKCTVCHKPICPQCLEQFGFFCSPLCKNKADMQGIAAPVYAGQKFEVEARFWRKTGLIFGAAVGAVVLLLGVWIWYAWFGSVPHTYFSVPFQDQPAYSGRSQIVGKDQLVFLHGSTLARYDLKSKKQVWSQELVSQSQIDGVTKEAVAADAQSNAESDNVRYRQVHTGTQIERSVKMALQAALLLHVSGHNIWVGNGDTLTQYDWDTGKVLHEITLPETGNDLVEADGELQVLGAESVTHINLASGDTRVEQFLSSGAEAPTPRGNASTGGGLPLTGSGNGNALDPTQVANDAQNLKTPARIALPALLANAAHEQQLEAALNDNPEHPHAGSPAAAQPGAQSFQLVPGANGFVGFSMRLLEQKTEERTAMKEAPKKSALDGDVTTARTAEVANEILNGMQRDQGNDTVTEDVSRYQVTVHVSDPANTPDWTGEVTGPPQLFALKTVNVIAAGKDIIVLDQNNKKLWQATLTYSVPGGGEFPGMKSSYGEGPCVEHGNTLYVFDQAVVSAFDLTTGNARWRLPSVGVVGLFFDDQGMVYVNTTSANPDDVKYSRQIDITKTTENILMKVDPANGKTLWSIKPGGFISYLSGKFIYTTQSFDPNPTDEEVLNDSLVGLEKPPYFRIARINPKNGRTMWEYYDGDHVPFFVQFDGSTIELVYKRKVEVLKYLTF